MRTEGAPKRLLQVIPVLSKGGAERIVVSLLNSAVAEGWDAELLVFTRSSHEEGFIESVDNRVRIRSVFGSFKAPIHGPVGKFFRKLQYPLIPAWVLLHSRYLRTFDIVHCHLPLASWLGTWVTKLKRAKRQSLPVVVETFHADWEWTPKRLRPFFWHNWKNRDGLIVTTRTPPRPEEVEAGLPGVKSVEIRLGAIDPKIQTLTDSDLADFKAKLSLDDESVRFVVSTISRMNTERHTEMYVPLTKSLVEKCGETFRFLWMGDGPNRAEIEDQARREGVHHLISFAGFTSDIRPGLRATTVYVTMVNGLDCGVAGLEAMLAGIPVVGLQCQQGFESSDWITASKNPDVVADAILAIVNSESLALDQIAMQQKRVHELHTVNAMWTANRTFYLSLLSHEEGIALTQNGRGATSPEESRVSQRT